MIRTALIIFFLFSTSSTLAMPSAPTPDEMPTLPAYCKAKLSPDLLDDKQYSEMIGPDWLHIHHYCFALNFANRYYKYFDDKNLQRWSFGSALTNFDYMFSHAAPNFWMRAEMHTQKGRLLAAAKNYSEALGEFEKALQDNPNYAEAYAALSDLYLDLGQKPKALSAVERGLHRLPDKKSLQKRYNKLTGKTFVPPPPTVEQEAQKSQPPSVPSEKPLMQDTSADGATPAPTQVAPEVPTSSAQEKIGTPTNPYCRFCP